MSQACNKGNCNGVDRIYELSALKVYTKDTVQYTPRTTSTVFTLNFSLRDEYSTTKGTRSCRHKDLAVEHKNAWDENTLSFKCNKDFYSKSKLFLANWDGVNCKRCLDLVFLPTLCSRPNSLPSCSS